MPWKRMLSLAIFALAALASAAPLAGQQLQTGPQHDSGQSVTAAFEGWFPNPDGTFSILFGYYNRNLKQELDIPIGEGNKIEPGGPDRGQPTHFLTGRDWRVFTVTCRGFRLEEDRLDYRRRWSYYRDAGQPCRVMGASAFSGCQWEHSSVDRFCRGRPVCQWATIAF